MRILTFDTETTGKLDFKATHIAAHQPHLVQLGAILEIDNEIVATVDVIIRPAGWEISEEVSKIHGITHQRAMEVGISLANATYMFRDLVATADRVVAHNINFDQAVMTKALHESEVDSIPWEKVDTRCTMLLSTPILKIAKNGGASSSLNKANNWKWPSLAECMQYFYQENIFNAHRALVDAEAARKVYHALRRIGAAT
jgi:DNA polymerase III subunit epsilon